MVESGRPGPPDMGGGWSPGCPDVLVTHMFGQQVGIKKIPPQATFQATDRKWYGSECV